MQLAIRLGTWPSHQSATLFAVIALAGALTALSTTGAQANEWCGYTTHEDAVVECGYTTAADCENAVGKGGMCFIDPDLALNEQRSRGSVDLKPRARG